MTGGRTFFRTKFPENGIYHKTCQFLRNEAWVQNLVRHMGMFKCPKLARNLQFSYFKQNCHMPPENEIRSGFPKRALPLENHAPEVILGIPITKKKTNFEGKYINCKKYI